MAILFLFPSSKARVGAMSSANWVEVPGGRGLVYMIPRFEITVYPTLSFPSETKLLPLEYQMSSGLVRESSDNSSQGFIQRSKFLDKSERGESPWQ